MHGSLSSGNPVQAVKRQDFGIASQNPSAWNLDYAVALGGAAKGYISFKLSVVDVPSFLLMKSYPFT